MWFSFIPLLGGLIEKIFGSRKERDSQKADLRRLQMEINAAEASHSSLFVAGWRPFVGWVGAIAYAIAFIIDIFIPGVLILHYGDFSTIEGANIVLVQLHTLPFLTYIGVLSAMLGLGMGIRTFEKSRGIAQSSIKDLSALANKKLRDRFFKLYKKEFTGVGDDHEDIINEIFSKMNEEDK